MTERAHEKEVLGDDGHSASLTDKASSTADDVSHTKLEPIKITPSRRSRRSRRSHRSRSRSAHSDDSDPFEALARALTPDIETEAEHAAREPISHIRTGTSVGSTASRNPGFEVFFDPDDPENPKNWPIWYQGWTMLVVSYSTWVCVLYSTSYTSSTRGLMEEYHVNNPTIVTLGVTTYLLGLAVGSPIIAPMSELYGRRPVYLVCMFLFTVLVLPCAMATSLAEILVVRFIGAFFASALIANSPGTVVDIADDDYRALYMSLWSIAPLNGPTTGPLIGGFVFQYLGWRWDNWLVMIMAGVSCILLLTVKETYAPKILQRKAARRRKETDDDRWWCRYDQKISTKHLLKLNLSRPFVLAFTEPILWCFNIWISIIYGILYLCFVAYPIIFTQHRGWGPGTTGLSFVGIGVGTLLVIAAEPLCRRMINSHAKDPETGRAVPEATASVICVGAVLTPVGQLVFAWTSLPTTIHWAVPIAFGIPFGAGNTLAFIYASNYLAGAYGVYAASALASNAVMRSVFGAVLPLAGPAMYERLTPQWAGTLLGLLEVLLIPIPFAFYRYGARIRARSPVIRQMREDQLKNESRRARHQARMERRAAREAEEAEQRRRAEAGILGEEDEEEEEEEQMGIPDADRDVEKEAGKSAPPLQSTAAAKDETAA